MQNRAIRLFIPLTRVSFIQKVSKRAFSSSNLTARERLRMRISDEVDFENEHKGMEKADKMDKYVKTHGWTVTAQPDSTRVELDKLIGNMKVKVIFHAQLPGYDYSLMAEQKAEDDPFLQKYYLPFVVVLDKPEKEEKMVFNLVAYEKQIRINHFTTTPDPAEFIINKDQFLITDTFTGPEYPNINYSTQLKANYYMDMLGFDEYFVQFLYNAAWESGGT